MPSPLARFFFRSQEATDAVEEAGYQEVHIVVRGGYNPSVIRARTGVPLRIVFDRQEEGDCSSNVVFPELGLRRFLPPFAATTVEFTPIRSGPYEFSCGMNMIHGIVQVEGESTAPPPSGTEQAVDQSVFAADSDDVEVIARRREVAGLSRRLLVGGF